MQIPKEKVGRIRIKIRRKGKRTRKTYPKNVILFFDPVPFQREN